jgi:hypothetical protein
MFYKHFLTSVAQLLEWKRNAWIPGLNPTVNLGASLTKETIYCRIILNRGGQCSWVKHILLVHAMFVGNLSISCWFMETQMWRSRPQKISPVSCYPTVPKFYPPTLNFLWPRIKLHIKTFFLHIQTRKNMYMEQFQFIIRSKTSL